MNWNFLVTESKNPRNRILFGVLLATLLGAVFLSSIQQNFVNKNTLESYSSYERSGNTVSMFLSSKDRLFQMKKKGEGGVRDFLNSSFKDQNGTRLFPDKYGDNATLIRTKQDTLSKKDHYIYQQNINGVPVFGGEIGVHVKEYAVYALDGKILYNDQVPKPILTRDDAKEKALQKARNQTNVNVVAADAVEQTIINKKLLGTSTDGINYLTFRVFVESDTKDVVYSKFFYIDAVSGDVLMEQTNIFDIMNRIVSDCGGSRSCRVVRSEGQPASGISEADSLYSILGEIYAFYKDRYNRDSVDGRGSALKGNTNMSPVSLPCSNADFNSLTLTMSYCPRMVAKDVSMHEFTHGAISTTAGLAYQDQYGALNEAIADIFASNIDGNWTLGEATIMGVIRDLSNPPSVPRHPQPDRLFHSLYYCGYDQGTYVHINSGVVNKAYFLMTDGGKFNGCEMSGIGRNRSIDIVYQALTTYLRPTSNFKDFYSAMLQACGDKFPSEPAVCENVKRAMEATEIDQQPTGNATSPKCSGKTAAAATCASGGVAPTVPPASGGSTPSPTSLPGVPSPTPATGGSGEWKVRATPFCEGSVSHIKYDYEIPLGELGIIETINSAGNPLGIEDMSSWDAVVGGRPRLAGKGTHIAKGNWLTPPDTGLRNNYDYTVEIHNGSAAITNTLVFTMKVKTLDCTKITPTLPGSSPSPTVADGPTPTPRQMFNCQPDPKCLANKKSIQLCPLVCQSMSSGQPNPTQSPSSPTATGTPGGAGSPTSSVPTATIAPTSTALDIGALISTVSEDRLREYMESLVDDDATPGYDETQTRYTGSQGHTVETDYVHTKFSEFGVSASFQNFSFSGRNARNVIGTIDGQDPNSVYIVSSHIDSTAQTNSGTTDPAPGADDNASGSVAVVEAARVLKSIQSKLKHSIVFITFSGEEQGLKGSYYYVSNLPSGKKIKGVINLDMIGNKSGSECVNFLYKNYNGGDVISSKIIEIISKYNLGLGGISGASSNGQSDHKPFWDVGIPAVFGHECTFSPVYHSINDKTNSINYSQIAKTTKAVVGAIAEFATK